MNIHDRFKTLVHRLVLMQQKHRINNQLEISEEIINALLSVGIKVKVNSQSLLIEDKWENFKE